MDVNPSIIFHVTLNWREVKALRRALEKEGGVCGELARKISEQVNRARREMIEQTSSILNEDSDDKT